VLRRLGRRTYGGDAADEPAVRGARVRTAACRRGLDAPRGGVRRGAQDLGRCTPRAVHTSGGARPREARARDVAARGRFAPNPFYWCTI
jgi:hypothetical protein